jgi:hypothetical protein
MDETDDGHGHGHDTSTEHAQNISRLWERVRPRGLVKIAPSNVDDELLKKVKAMANK